MRKSRHDSYEQAYNAQAVVEAEGSQLILATDVLTTPSDANELEVALEKVVQSVGACATDVGRRGIRECRGNRGSGAEG